MRASEHRKNLTSRTCRSLAGQVSAQSSTTTTTTTTTSSSSCAQKQCRLLRAKSRSTRQGCWAGGSCVCLALCGWRRAGHGLIAARPACRQPSCLARAGSGERAVIRKRARHARDALRAACAVQQGGRASMRPRRHTPGRVPAGPQRLARSRRSSSGARHRSLRVRRRQ